MRTLNQFMVNSTYVSDVDIYQERFSILFVIKINIIYWQFLQFFSVIADIVFISIISTIKQYNNIRTQRFDAVLTLINIGSDMHKVDFFNATQCSIFLEFPQNINDDFGNLQ